MAIWSEADLDKITDEFLTLMLDRREFTDRWTSSVEKELARSQRETRAADSVIITSPVVDVAKREDTLLPSFEELMHAVDASSQTFLSSADFTICHCEPEHNRDASLLFAARLQIDRIASKKIDRKRLGTAARRLLQLVRLFTTRISSILEPVLNLWRNTMRTLVQHCHSWLPGKEARENILPRRCFSEAFQISNTSAFATSLCDMLYTFCDCATHTVYTSEQKHVCELRRAVDDFNEIVVEKLSKAAFEAQCARRTAAKIAHTARQQFFSPQPVRLRRPLVQIQQRSPGYLLPPNLLKKREQMIRTRSVPSIRPTIPSAATSSNKERLSSAPLKGRQIPSKSEDALEKEQEAAIRLARKISSEVIKDLRNRYGKVDIGMLGI